MPYLDAKQAHVCLCIYVWEHVFYFTEAGATCSMLASDIEAHNFVIDESAVREGGETCTYSNLTF